MPCPRRTRSDVPAAGLPPPDHSSRGAPRPAASTAPRGWQPRSRPPMGARDVGGRRQRGGAARRGRRGVPSGRPVGMGGSESSHGGRKVSFGLDEREQVRVLQGIRVRRCGAAGPAKALLRGTRQPRAGLRPSQRTVCVVRLRAELRVPTAAVFLCAFGRRSWVMGAVCVRSLPCPRAECEGCVVFGSPPMGAAHSHCISMEQNYFEISTAFQVEIGQVWLLVCL